MTNLNELVVDKAVPYSTYRKTVNELVEAGKTTGPNQEEWLVDYTRLNVQRMNRWDKTWLVPEKFETTLLAIETPMIWLTITEGWCGDAAQIVPIIDKLAQVNPLIQHRLLLRDENPDFMDQFLTNGTRSIPKIVLLKEQDLSVLGHWGPRPRAAQELLESLKKDGQLPKEELYNQLHAWYAKNKGIDVATEFMSLVNAVV